MKRPSFQFYTGDWQANSNLRRCSHEEKGIWVDVMCLLHDQAEYGVVRWPLKEIAQSVGTTPAKLQKLVSKGVLKGTDTGKISEALIFTPRHGRRDGDPVTLLPAQQGPIWYSSRMVTDEYKRIIRGESSPNQSPHLSPKGGIGAAPKHTPNPAPDPSPSRARPSSSSSSSVNTSDDVFTTRAQHDCKFAMFPEWQPSDDTLRLLEARLVPREFSTGILPEFTLYWLGRPASKNYQGGWDQKFLGQAVRQWERYQDTLARDNTPRPIAPDFMPTDETMESLRVAGVPEDLILGSLDQFRRYWIERNEIHGSWNAKFHTWAMGDYARFQQGQGQNLVDKLQDRSWADEVIHDPAH